MERAQEFVKKHWMWFVAGGILLAVWLLTRTRTVNAAGAPGLTPSQQAALAQSAQQAAVARDQLSAQYAATQLGAQTQVQLAQIGAAGEALKQQTALKAILAQLEAQRQVALGSQAVQENSTAAAAAAFNRQQTLGFFGTLLKNAPAIIREFRPTVPPASDGGAVAPPVSFIPGPTDFSGPIYTPTGTGFAGDPEALASGVGGF